MKEPLLMQAICYDSVLLTGKELYSFFEDGDDEQGNRFTDVVEANIIEWIFNHPCKVTDTLFFQELKIEKSHTPYFEVRSPVIKDTSAPGNIDILLVDKTSPQYSIAFQVKRIKAVIGEDDISHLKISQIDEGIQQTKWMHEKYRFHKSYLMLVIVTDSQRRKHDSQIFRYNTVQEKSVIYEHGGFGDLPEDAGIYILEINQPSSNDINQTAMIAAKTLRFAKASDQLNDTTNRISSFLKTVGR